MAMGTTGTVNITPEMMRNALTAIEGYVTKQQDLHNQLDETMSGLIPGNFSGAAADGFKTFYEAKIVPAVGENLKKLTDALTSIVQGTLDAIPDTDGLDDQLGDENKK